MSCYKYRKTIDPKCDDQPKCKWLVSKGCKNTTPLIKSKSPKKALYKSETIYGSNKCNKYRKTIDPKCDDQVGCKWVIGKKCLNIKDIKEDKPISSSNILYRRCRNIKNIYGPVSFNYYNFIVGGKEKNIIVLGDIHTPLTNKITKTRESDSIYYDEFIVDIIDKCQLNGKCLDFYLEAALTNDQGNPYKGGNFQSNILNFAKKSQFNDTLSYLRVLFYNCSNTKYNKNKDKCSLSSRITGLNYQHHIPINNLRLHNVDIRQSYKYIGIDDVKDDLFYSKKFKIFLSTPAIYSDILKYILNYRSKSRQDIIDLYSGVYKRDYILYIESLDKIKNIIQKELDKYESYKILPDDIDIRYLIYNANISTVYKQFLDIGQLAVDLYTLLRLFKKFDVSGKKKTRGPQLCKDEEDQTKIIIYAGNSHCNIYNNILINLFPNSLKFSTKSFDKIVKITKTNFNNFNEIMEDFCK